MSRFLVSTMPAAGHVHPAIPVVAELARRGHEVLWHTGHAYATSVERAGARFVPLRHAPDFTALPADPDPGTTGAGAAVSALRKLLVDRMAGQLADYEDIVAEYPVDAVLVDLCALGGQALHDRRGVPWATLGISPLTAMSPDTPPFGTGWRPPRGHLGRTGIRLYNALAGLLMRDLTRAYRRERAALGLPPLPHGASVFGHMLSPMLHLQASTPLIEYPRRPWPAGVHLVGPLLPDEPTATRASHGPHPTRGAEPSSRRPALPAWWPELAGAGTVVHVTQGTVATDPASLTRPAIEALADLDVLVVVSTPEPAALGPLPPNVRVAPYLPHALLLPHVDVMVSNGGYNGAKMALAHGVPLVIAPWGNDQPDVAARVAWAGAGVNLRTRAPSPAAVRAAVRLVLADPSYGRAARRVREEFSRYAGGGKAADLLERLAPYRT